MVTCNKAMFQRKKRLCILAFKMSVLRTHVRNRVTGKRENLHVFGFLRDEFFESHFLEKLGHKTVSKNYPQVCLRLESIGSFE